MKAVLGGEVFEHAIDGWQVSWESRGVYRHWCIQQKPTHSDEMLVVMKNPGSLSGDGANLRRDTTLRILRVVGDAVGLNQTIVNLFDFASPKLQELHDNWGERDGDGLVYEHIDVAHCRFILLAYGDLAPAHYSDYAKRISRVRTAFQSLPEVLIPTTNAGNPVHPMNWQRNKLMSQVIAAIKSHKRRA